VSLVGRFLETVDRERLLPDGSKVLVAVSGGADSVCLFELLRAVAPHRGLTMYGFHMNHRLRAAADDDEAFVRTLFARARVPLTVVRADVRRFAGRHRLGIEEAGRELRYRHMARLGRRVGCSRIALGHTSDDNLETMLLNLARGAGMTGLRGIPVVRMPFVRPLIDLARDEIEAWLRARGQTWREDESNRDEAHARNLIRRRVVPGLREINPEAVAAGRRTARVLAADDEYLESLARDAFSRVTRRTRHGLEIDLIAFSAYNESVKKRMVRQAIPRLESSGVDRVLVFLAGSSPRLTLGGGVLLARLRGHTARVTGKRTKETNGR
jgi:tRNA(Ile)-lysidine synthase